MAQDGLAFIVEVGTSIEDCLDVYEFARTHENVYCTLGVHPHYSSEYLQGEFGVKFEEWVGKLSKEQYRVQGSPLVAIGECGLDYYHNLSPRDVQKEVFIRQIKLAGELGMPLVVHSREAFEDTFRILSAHKEHLTNGVLIHCFGYGADELRQFSESLDAYFSFGGAVTYKNATKIQQALRACPRDRLLLETDAPYLAPCELRGKINEPKRVRQVAEFVAGELGMSFEDVAQITLENTRRFYRI